MVNSIRNNFHFNLNDYMKEKSFPSKLIFSLIPCKIDTAEDITNSNLYHSYFKGVFDAYSILLLLIASFALTCAAISRSSFFYDATDGLLLAGTFTIFTCPALLFICFEIILLIFIYLTCRSIDF